MGAATFIPLTFRPGEAYQFDWSHEDVKIAGLPVRVKVAHMRLCASRPVYVRAYPRETQEMLFDAHAGAFAFLGGVPTRGIYDNMKTAMTSVFTGKQRIFNRRSLIMADHYMVEPVNRLEEEAWIGKAGTLAVQLSRCDVVVLDEIGYLKTSIATKFNRSHVVQGEVSYLLPCFGRIEIDEQASGPQAVSMKSSVAQFHGFKEHVKPVSSYLLSEPAIIAGYAHGGVHERD